MRRTINENELADIVIEYYMSNLENQFEDIFKALLENGFDKSDLVHESWMKYDIFLCGLSIDSMAIFNLLKIDQANRIFKYISIDQFKKLNNKNQMQYSINEVAEYKRLWDDSIVKYKPPLDYVFSKLFVNLLGENLRNYSINSIQMMELISIVLPLFAGGWKRALEKYKPIK